MAVNLLLRAPSVAGVSHGVTTLRACHVEVFNLISALAASIVFKDACLADQGRSGQVIVPDEVGARVAAGMRGVMARLLMEF